MSEHTPAPWVTNGSAIEQDQATLAYVIAHVWDEEENGPPEYEANARLIAAAPALLEACRAAERFLGAHEATLPADAAQVYELVYAALVAATGGEPEEMPS